MTKDIKNIRLDGLSIIILIISGIVIIFSFFAPFIFVQKSILGINFSDTGEIGDTIGGIMSPFIAISGVFLTFLAFYIQFKANKLQRDLFRQELDSNKLENQFYEMLRLHKENVNDISITIKSSYFSGHETVKYESQIKGREVFKYFLNEITILYCVAKDIYQTKNQDFWIKKAYLIFFSGLVFDKSNDTLNKKMDGLFESKLTEIEDGNSKSSTQFRNSIYKYGINMEWPKYDLFKGHSSKLAHYYRHLFQTVKFIVNQNESFIGYSEKRNYLRILRAQLSNQEQAMLFYNWKSGFGEKWENEENHFFTDYRMIHNLYTGLLIQDFDLVEIFKLRETPYYRVEEDRENDFLFEIQDLINASG